MIPSTVTISTDQPIPGPIKVATIRELRSVVSVGLKEAKEFLEQAKKTETFPVQAISQDEYNRGIHKLRQAGLNIGGEGALLFMLRQAAVMAIQDGREELGNDILRIVLAEKLRGNT